ncbi:D-malate dehydrogenase [decarboxylating] [Serratia odorifera]|uniref:D-malate dehydrogenase [decarboxylating] n=1 Tax=Serratia odorifera TaxID=618 RepID=A0A447KSE9_SEROD|nr:D-malate dehydrogenase [decarboxylating] [Serratia odorifera]
MLPDDWFERLQGFDAIYFGAVGWPDKVPDHVSLWGSLLKFRRDFDQYVNLRPVRLFPGVACPLANKKPGDIDFYVVRENTEGEYSSLGGRMFEGTEREMVVQESVFTRQGVDRILQYAFELAQQRPRKSLTAATKSNGMAISMPYWDERVAAMAQHYPDIRWDKAAYRHPLRPLRAEPGAFRRGRRLQPVRRYSVGSRPGLYRYYRYCAIRQPSTRSATSRRCSSRCTAPRQIFMARTLPIRSP